MRQSLTIAALCALTLACAPSLQDKDPDTTDTPHTDSDPGPDLPEDAIVVDASDSINWVYLDLESEAMVMPETPEDSTSWDLGFRRFRIKVNGGVSGTGDVEAAYLPQQDFDTLSQAPREGYLTDLADGDDENEEPEYALDSWFDYNLTTHVVTASDAVYAVRTVEGSYYKIQMLEYYDEAGSPGYLAFRVGTLEPPTTP